MTKVEGYNYSHPIGSSRGGSGSAIDFVYSDADGKMWGTDGQKCSRINFCPYTGYESKNKFITIVGEAKKYYAYENKKPESRGGYGESVNFVYSEPSGMLWASNGSEASQINFCPFTGYKATLQIS